MTTLLKIEYDGTSYAGWQNQKNAVTVQSTIESALQNLVGVRVPIVGAGRTDAGVHARGQVAHLHHDEPLRVPAERLARALNGDLPASIRIVGLSQHAGYIHAVRDATSREYSYSIHWVESVFRRHFSTRVHPEPDFALLQEAAGLFAGSFDFTTFSKLNEETKDYVCRVMHCSWSRTDEYSARLVIRADRFVYGMVRALVGAMLDAGQGKRSATDLRDSLAECNRALGSRHAPATGLVLEKVGFPEELGVAF